MAVELDDANIDSEIREFERKTELARVMAAFKLDPYDVLNVPYTADDADIARAYRTISLKIHPDRCSAALKIDAQNAFSKLTQAKEDISNDSKKPELDHHIGVAKEKCDVTLAEMAAKQLKTAKKSAAAGGPPVSDAAVAVSFDLMANWRKEVKEVLIENEWRKRQSIRQSKDMQTDAIAAAEEKKRKAADEQKHDDDWETTRDLRVGSWRTFQVANKISKKPKPPRQFAEDASKTFVRRMAAPNSQL